MTKFNELANKFSKAMENEVVFVMAVVIFVIVLFALAIIAEKIYKKQNPEAANISKAKKITLIAVFSALAAVLMYIEFPVFFAAFFYKIDFSEIPVLISGFMLGPVASATTELVKILIKLVIKPTETAFIGEFANFVVGCAFVIPASIIYQRKKTKKTAAIAMTSGTLIATLTGMFTNAFILLPAFAVYYGGMPIEALIAEGTKVNGAITNMLTFILLSVTPLNLVKYGLVSIIVFFIYKKISTLLKAKL